MFQKINFNVSWLLLVFPKFQVINTQLSLTGIFPRIYRYVQIYFRGDHPWIFSLWPPQHFTIPKLNYLTDHAWKLQGIIYGERSKEIRYCLVWIINVSATVSFLFKFWEDNFFQAKKNSIFGRGQKNQTEAVQWTSTRFL